MYKISDIISMPVISIYESEYCGIVYNVMIDCQSKKVKYICIINDKDNISKTIAVENIYKIGPDCIFIKNLENLLLQINIENELKNYSNPINLIAYNLEGECLGTVRDIICNNRNKIEEFIINNKSYNINNICNLSNAAILINNKKIDIKKFKTTNLIKVTSTNDKVITLSAPATATKKNNEEIQSSKLITDFRFLTGRKLNKDILTIHGEIIAKMGNIITKEIITKASYYGKLVEIARYSSK